MAVIIGSARIDENGKAHGGKAGDNNGKEVSTQNWYKHSKGWRVLRAKSPDVAAKIAACMKAACNNKYIGYDQYQRLTLYKAAEPFSFDCAKVATKCETDCSALVRVCLAYAGIKVSNFRTTNQASVMLASGAFVEMTGSKYTDKSDYLKAGDVLVTKTQGHTVVVLTDGAKAVSDNPAASGSVPTTDTLEAALRKGDKGTKVKKMQTMLIACGYSCGKWGADGSYGNATLEAVEAFQRANGLAVDGVYGQKTHAALYAAYVATQGFAKRYVIVTGKTVNVRTKSNVLGKILGTVKKGTKLEYRGETASNGWHAVKYNGANAWISGAYSKLEG